MSGSEEETAQAAPRRRVRKQAPRANGWTKARRKLFLETLAATCNVTASAKAAGMSAVGARQLRLRDGEFSQLWDQMLAVGRDRLEEMLLLKVLGQVPSGDNPDDLDTEATPAEFDPQLALDVLKMRDQRDPRGANKQWAAGPTEAEVDAELLRRLDEAARRIVRR